MSETFDLTPTWRGVMPALMAALEDGTPEGKRLARLELTRLARNADMLGEVVATLRTLARSDNSDFAIVRDLRELAELTEARAE